ncbi:hypothetical protein BKA70DRAFT_1574136 [Coprinopsis sp. MPI-PUGE-AT-0042]|nr:hypothetical protein BKA70DRAFT_1574136 [Coprinopsis sp. MPI-PUGE-AT-0042]
MPPDVGQTRLVVPETRLPQARLFFLDDTLGVMYHSALEGNFLVSDNDGKTWRDAEGLPNFLTPPDNSVYWISLDAKVKESVHLHTPHLFSSADFFDKERKVEDPAMDAKSSRGAVGFTVVSKSAAVAIKQHASKEIGLYVTLDAKSWAKAHLPHTSNAKLRENAYRIIESTTHSLAVDVVLHNGRTIGTLFVSNSNGTYFVESLRDTNRNEMGFVDYERVDGVDGIGLANVVANAQEVESRGSRKRLRSMIKFDDGRSWQPLRAPRRDEEGNRAKCDPSDEDTCALHLHSVTTPHNYGHVFSSPAPGVVMGVGTASESLKTVAKVPHKFTFGDQKIKYAVDMGKTWETYDFGVSIRSRALTSLPGWTSQKFFLFGQTSRESQALSNKLGKFVVIHLDFSKMCKNKGKESDFECDYNYVWNGDKCEQTGPESVPPNVCLGDPETETYWGSSGYRKVVWSTCKGGLELDEQIEKPCSRARPAEGNVIHERLNFKSRIVRFAHFKGSATILVRLLHHSIWQSSNQGYTWNQVHPDSKFLAFCHHKYSNGRAYLITNANQVWYTTDTGRSWHNFNARNPPNTFEARVLHFSPSDDDYLIRTGDSDCPGRSHHAEAYFSRNHGRDWTLIEKYFRNCAFAEDVKLGADPTEIVRESLKEKSGLQQIFGAQTQLVAGGNFHARQKKLFESVVGFTKFLEFLVVAELDAKNKELDLQVSLDGVHFASGQFLRAYTALESATGALFLHMTMAQNPPPLDGIAIANIVENTAEAKINRTKKLQTRITHNDGSTWKSVTPPLKDSLGNWHACSDTKRALHLQDTLPAAILEQRAAVPLLQV